MRTSRRKYNSRPHRPLLVVTSQTLERIESSLEQLAHCDLNQSNKIYILAKKSQLCPSQQT